MQSPGLSSAKSTNPSLASSSDERHQKALARALRLAWWAVILAAVVVSLGAYTRLADAGLGCPDWPGCYGFLGVPHSEAKLQVAAERFPHAPVEHAKGWAEMIHRYAAGTLGVLIGALALSGWRQRHNRQYPRKLSALLLVLVVVQALFGMWTVTLNLWPQVVTLHLLGGLATLTLLFLLVLRLRAAQDSQSMQTFAVSQSGRGLRRLAWCGLLVVVLQVMLGGWTSANYAAIACPDFPQCQQQWWPEPMSLTGGFNVLQTVGPSYLGGLLGGPERVAIHVVHRLGALLVTLVLVTLSLCLWRSQRRELAATLALALCAQLIIGIANILWQFPLALALAHNTGAAILLLSMTLVLCHLHGLQAADGASATAADPQSNVSESSAKGIRYESPLTAS